MAGLERVCVTSITFHLTAAPKLFTHVETNNPAAITGESCVGDAECLCTTNTHRNVSLCNSSYMTARWIIKNVLIFKNKMEKKKSVYFPLDVKNLNFTMWR